MGIRNTRRDAGGSSDRPARPSEEDRSSSRRTSTVEYDFGDRRINTRLTFTLDEVLAIIDKLNCSWIDRFRAGFASVREKADLSPEQVRDIRQETGRILAEMQGVPNGPVWKGVVLQLERLVEQVKAGHPPKVNEAVPTAPRSLTHV